MSKRKIQVPVTFGIPKRKADGSVNLVATTTYEVSTDDYMLMDTYRQKEGWLLFSENEFTNDEVPDDDAPSDTKSPSQRLRNILYVYHIQRGGKTEDFRQFYESQVEKVIDTIKKKLD